VEDTVFVGFEDVCSYLQDDAVVDVIYLGAEFQAGDRLRRVVYVELGFGGAHRDAFKNMERQFCKSSGVELQVENVRGGGRLIADSFVKEIKRHSASHDFGSGPRWIWEELSGHLRKCLEQWEIKS